VRDFIYFAAVLGAALSLTLLHVGEVYRRSGTWLDRALFKKRWLESIPANERGGPVKQLVHCPSCTSFWVSIAFSNLWYCPLGGGWMEKAAIALGCVALTFTWQVIAFKLGLYEM
jgi:hypothetical protein